MNPALIEQFYIAQWGRDFLLSIRQAAEQKIPRVLSEFIDN